MHPDCQPGSQPRCRLSLPPATFKRPSMDACVACTTDYTADAEFRNELISGDILPEIRGPNGKVAKSAEP